MTNPLTNDLSNWLSRAQLRLDVAAHTPTLEHIGIVERIGDGVATVSGLPWTRLDELLRFDGDTLGLAFRIDADSVGCVLLGDSQGIVAGSQVRGKGC